MRVKVGKAGMIWWVGRKRKWRRGFKFSEFGSSSNVFVSFFSLVFFGIDRTGN